MNGCCGTCKYGHYDKIQGYVCVNDESEYVADFVSFEHWCEDWESNNKEDGSWITRHVWKCTDCGKEIY